MNLKGKKFENARLGMEINVYEFDEKEWFMSTEVCKLLEHSNPRKAVSDMVWEDEKTTKHIDFIESIEGVTNGDTPKKINSERTFVTETGLYQLIFRSRVPKAREFQKWVFEEVLPSIRKNNFYVDRDYISKEQYQRLKDMLLIFCENGKIGLPRASEKIFGNKTELNERLMNMGLIDREKCWYDENFKCVDKDSGKIYPIFVCDVKGKYRDGEVSNTLQVSLTNHGFVYLHEMFKNNMNLGLN